MSNKKTIIDEIADLGLIILDDEIKKEKTPQKNEQWEQILDLIEEIKILEREIESDMPARTVH